MQISATHFEGRFLIIHPVCLLPQSMLHLKVPFEPNVLALKVPDPAVRIHSYFSLGGYEVFK